MQPIAYKREQSICNSIHNWHTNRLIVLLPMKAQLLSTYKSIIGSVSYYTTNKKEQMARTQSHQHMAAQCAIFTLHANSLFLSIARRNRTCK